MDNDIIKILISTDNHLGYLEKDPIRCDDSLAAFEEVLYTAKVSGADFVLLAGDMFHENKPSRRVLNSSLTILRKYCYGSDPVFIEVMNEQSELFKNPWGRVNYEDPYHAISLPVFAIHGNHDDPSREGGNECLCAMDLLASSNLINYFGKAEQVDDIEITPIIISKGNTKIALYGLGAIRDERLYRMWNLGKIKFIRPTVEEGNKEYFNIFVLHQNRDYGRGSKNCVHESMIPEWMDVVVWGNEHQCFTSFSESLVGTFRIYQPGSSVATSLVEAESNSHPKHMGILEIQERKFRLKPQPYTQVRSFVYGEVNLCDRARYNLDPADSKFEEKAKDVLARTIQQMIEQAKEKALNTVPYYLQRGSNFKSVGVFQDVDESVEDVTGSIRRATSVHTIATTESSASGGKEVMYKLKDPHMVLVRLRVEHPGLESVHRQRFGAQFVGSIANPAEVLLLAKVKKDRARDAGAEGGDRNTLLHLYAEDLEDGVNTVVRDLVQEALENTTRKLVVLNEADLLLALENYVSKKHLSAISDVVQESLKRAQDSLAADKDVSVHNKDLLKEAVARVNKPTMLADGRAAPVVGRKQAEPNGRGKGATPVPVGKRKGKLECDSDFDDEPMAAISVRSSRYTNSDSEEEVVAKPAPKKRGMTTHNSSDSEEEVVVKSTNAKRGKISRSQDSDVEPPPKKAAPRRAVIKKTEVVDVIDSDCEPMPDRTSFTSPTSGKTRVLPNSLAAKKKK